VPPFSASLPQESSGTASTCLGLSGLLDTAGERGLLGVAFATGDGGSANNPANGDSVPPDAIARVVDDPHDGRMGQTVIGGRRPGRHRRLRTPAGGPQPSCSVTTRTDSACSPPPRITPRSGVTSP